MADPFSLCLSYAASKRRAPTANFRENSWSSLSAAIGLSVAAIFLSFWVNLYKALHNLVENFAFVGGFA
ncbi:hypothetical protein [Clostridia bacterium]